MAPEPSFDVPLVNVTVVAGQSIVLQCSIDNLGNHKVKQPTTVSQNYFRFHSPKEKHSIV